jgi:hypothetical protein
MSSMPRRAKRLAVSCLSTALLLAASAGHAQSPNGLAGGSRFNPPLPASPPPPSMAVPKVPQLDAPIHYDYRPAPRPSFSDRITSCLDQAAAAGVKPSRRAAYSRNCANRD